MADETLPEYLDRMIYTLYGSVQRGVGYVRKHLLKTEVVEYIEDESTGRSHPIADSADHFLLRKFDECRRAPIPTIDSIERGCVLQPDVDGDPNWSRLYCDAAVGEIPWRAKHADHGWYLCMECAHPFDLHADDDNGGPITEQTAFTYCGVGNCSCGMNTRR